MIHTVKGFSAVNEAEVNIFLEFFCFFYDPVDDGNLISGSSAFSKSSLNFWKFLVHLLLKPCLENFEHYLSAFEVSAIVQTLLHTGIDLTVLKGIWVVYHSLGKKQEAASLPLRCPSLS